MLSSEYSYLNTSCTEHDTPAATPLNLFQAPGMRWKQIWFILTLQKTCKTTQQARIHCETVEAFGLLYIKVLCYPAEVYLLL